MVWWSHLSALGGLSVTFLISIGIAAWLGAARHWGLVAAWCLLFATLLLLVCGSQIAYISWNIGVRSIDFEGFSGHAARSAVVFPVALFLLSERKAGAVPWLAIGLGTLLGLGVALARVKLGAHTVSEASAGCILGVFTAAAFIAYARSACGLSPHALLLGRLSAAILLVVAILLPHARLPSSHQWLTAVALKLSGHDRVYVRHRWRHAERPYVPPCPTSRVRFDYFCT
jgi:hypothetical protein